MTVPETLTTINVINLTTGLEWLPGIRADAFSRLQSSHLEGAHWQKFLDSVDENILYHLATGHKVVIHDCGSRNPDGISRVVWQGVPLIRWCCERAWKLEHGPCLFRGHRVDRWVASLHLDLRKLKYYRKHLSADAVNLVGQSKKSFLDGRKDVGELRICEAA